MEERDLTDDGINKYLLNVVDFPNDLMRGFICELGTCIHLSYGLGNTCLNYLRHFAIFFFLEKNREQYECLECGSTSNSLRAI